MTGTTTANDAIFRARRILVVAPHPDDETLGCGGLIALACESGALVHTLFTTDGGASHPPSPLWPRERLARTRKREAEAALQELGAGSQPRTFLRLPDAVPLHRGSPIYEVACKQVSVLVDALRPDLVALPWRRDPHCDHRAAFALLSHVLLARGAPMPPQLEYAIWLDELGEVGDFPRDREVERISLDITSAVERKRRALRAHQTQLGAIATEAPGGFVLTNATTARLIQPSESYFRLCAP